MGVEICISSKVLLRHVISVLTIISLENRVASVGLKDEFCKPAECGKDMIGHPFRNHAILSTNGSFQIECDDRPVLQLLPFREYPVDYDDQSHRLSSEFERTGNACFVPTTPPGNSETDDGFEHPSFLLDQKPSYLTFLHYCSSFLNVKHPCPYLTCPSFGANHTCVALVSRPEDLNPYLPACASHIFVPVELPKWDIKETENGEFGKKLTHGFTVRWNLTSWDIRVKCKESGGKSMRADGDFLCLCSGKAYQHPCRRVLAAR